LGSFSRAKRNASRSGEAASVIFSARFAARVRSGPSLMVSPLD
jgi:hypothetical protein